MNNATRMLQQNPYRISMTIYEPARKAHTVPVDIVIVKTTIGAWLAVWSCSISRGAVIGKGDWLTSRIIEQVQREIRLDWNALLKEMA